jgi:hypothetical protein
MFCQAKSWVSGLFSEIIGNFTQIQALLAAKTTKFTPNDTFGRIGYVKQIRPERAVNIIVRYSLFSVLTLFIAKKYAIAPTQ